MDGLGDSTDESNAIALIDREAFDDVDPYAIAGPKGAFALTERVVVYAPDLDLRSTIDADLWTLGTPTTLSVPEERTYLDLVVEAMEACNPDNVSYVVLPKDAVGCPGYGTWKSLTDSATVYHLMSSKDPVVLSDKVLEALGQTPEQREHVLGLIRTSNPDLKFLTGAINREALIYQFFEPAKEA